MKILVAYSHRSETSENVLEWLTLVNTVERKVSRPQLIVAAL